MKFNATTMITMAAAMLPLTAASYIRRSDKSAIPQVGPNALARRGNGPPPPPQLKFTQPPFTRFILSAKNTGNDDSIIVDLANCGTESRWDPEAVRWSKANVGEQARRKCQTWLLTTLPWIDPDAYMVSLSDTLKRLAWDFTEAKHGGKLTPAMDDQNPVWEQSQQVIIKCDNGASQGYYGKSCLVQYKGTELYLAVPPGDDLTKQNGRLQMRNCKGAGADRVKWDLQSFSFGQDNHNIWKVRVTLAILSVAVAECAGRSDGPARLDKALAARQAACFIVGDAILPEEVSRGIPGLAQQVQCDNQVEISPDIPNIISGDISLVDFDFQKSNLSPLGFAEAAFAIPDQPSTISRDADETLQQQLNAYLAWEAAVRSQNAGNTQLLAQVKSVKFFLGFQRARINAGRGFPVGPADTVEHQLGKVLKNSIFASDAERKVAEDLANLVG